MNYSFLSLFASVILLTSVHLLILGVEVIIIIIIIIILLLTAIEMSLRGSSPYTSTGKTNKNKYT